MFTPKMKVAVRVLRLVTTGNECTGWCREPVLRRIHGIQRNTLRALEVRGVVERRVADSGPFEGRWLCRLSPLALAILEAGRA